MKMRNTDLGRPMCGFCMTGHHDSCKPVIKYYDKEWYCYCEECHPVLQSDTDNEQKEESNDEGTSTTGDIEPHGHTD